MMQSIFHFIFLPARPSIQIRSVCPALVTKSLSSFGGVRHISFSLISLSGCPCHEFGLRHKVNFVWSSASYAIIVSRPHRTLSSLSLGIEKSVRMLTVLESRPEGSCGYFVLWASYELCDTGPLNVCTRHVSSSPLR